MNRSQSTALGFLLVLASACHVPNLWAADAHREKPLKVGEKGDNFTLQSLGGEKVEFYKQLEKGPVVLLVLRGYPGYQCPICSRQVVDYVRHAEGFAKLGAQVIMIYPGPSENLQAKAEEFMAKTELPDNFLLLIDPDYEFTNLYALRWDAPQETAYPSTLVFDKEAVVKLAVVSKGHGGRTKADEALDALKDSTAAAE